MNSYAFLSAERYLLRKGLASRYAERRWYQTVIAEESSRFWRFVYRIEVIWINIRIKRMRREYREVTRQWKELREAISEIE